MSKTPSNTPHSTVCKSCGCYYDSNGECDCNRPRNGNHNAVPAEAPASAKDSKQIGLDAWNREEERRSLERDKWMLEPSPEELAQTVRAKYHAFTSDEVAERLREAGNQRYLVANMLPLQSTALLLGDSGVGKSALLYQLGLCVASGEPFFNHQTEPGLVLYFDYENNMKEAHDCINTIAEFLKLSGVPKNFIVWNAHDAPKDWVPKGKSMFAMIRDLRPTLTIIDTLSKAFPDTEEKNSDASTLMSELTDIVSKTGSSIIFSHHFKKSRGVSDEQWKSLPPQDKVQSSRGASGLYNGVDLRLIVSKPAKVKSFDKTSTDGTSSAVECAFEVEGFRRLGGDTTTIAVERVFREGEPFGYRQILSTGRLKNPRYQQVFESLPNPFRPKDVEGHFPTSGSSVQMFIKTCAAAGKITQVELPVTPGYRGTKGYAKVDGNADVPAKNDPTSG